MFPRNALSPPPLLIRPASFCVPSPPTRSSASRPSTDASFSSSPSAGPDNGSSASPAAASSPSASPPSLPASLFTNLWPSVSTRGAAACADSDNHAASRRQLPNEIWGEIAHFSLRNDVLNLRASSNALKQEADRAVTVLRLNGSANISAFATANCFPYIRSLNLYGADNDSLLLLARRLAAFPREHLRITLMSRQGSISEALIAIAALPLASLLVHRFHQASDNGLAALSACRYPLELTGNLTREALVTASRIATLTTLCSEALGFDDHVAASYAAHPALKFLLLHANSRLSSRGVASIAAMPALRDLVLYNADELAAPLDVMAASALAANRTLESLYIETGASCLHAPSFAALSGSQTLKLLRISICENMHQIEGMRGLQCLMLSGKGEACPVLTPTAAHAIVNLPHLRFLTVRFARCEPQSLRLLFSPSSITNMYVRGTHVTPDAIAAIIANTRLSALKLDDAGLSPEDIRTLSYHPNLMTLTVDGVTIKRPSRETTIAPVDHVI